MQSEVLGYSWWWLSLVRYISEEVRSSCMVFVDRLFSTGVNSCIMKIHLCRRQSWFYWVSNTPALKFL
jgi:hypothetical protein